MCVLISCLDGICIQRDKKGRFIKGHKPWNKGKKIKSTKDGPNAYDEYGNSIKYFITN